MPYTSRLATEHSTIPVLTITIYGQTIPAIPLTDADIDTTGLPPQFGAGQVQGHFWAMSNYVPPKGNYPAIFGAGYSTNNDFNDYIGSKIYTMSAFDTDFNDGEVVSEQPLVLPEAITVALSGTPNLFDQSLMIPSVSSTPNNPECLLFLAPINNAINPFYWSGLKKDADGNTTVVKLFETGGQRLTTGGRLIYAACTEGDQYFVLWNNNINYPYVGGHTDSYAFTICEERIYPDAEFINYSPGFDDPNLPASMDGFDFYSPNNLATFGDYTPIAIHGCDIGFAITYKKKISNGNWEHKYLLVSKDWVTFQWLEFVAGNSLAQDVINQSNAQPFDSLNSSLDLSTLVTAYHKDETWYVLGGSLNDPIVCTSNPVDDSYGIVSWGTTNLGEEDYFSQSGIAGGTALIDGRFFGYTHESFPYSIGGPNDCTIITLLSSGQKVRGVECFFRPWTYTLDAHDFFNLRLGCDETIVYDDYAEEWYSYTTGDLDTWRIVTGINWVGGQVFAQDYGSNILVGDEELGVLYFLDPTKENDDDPADPAGTKVPFQRVAQGQIVHVGRDYDPCYAVQLIGSMGDVQSSLLTDVTLSISDDAGNTYVSCGTFSIPSGSYNYRVEWNSLGSIRMPGRLFKIVDYGSMLRIDGMERLYAPES